MCVCVHAANVCFLLFMLCLHTVPFVCVKIFICQFHKRFIYVFLFSLSLSIYLFFFFVCSFVELLFAVILCYYCQYCDFVRLWIVAAAAAMSSNIGHLSMSEFEYFKSHIIANRSICMFTHRVLWHFIARTFYLSLAPVWWAMNEKENNSKTKQRINDEYMCTHTYIYVSK